MGGHFRAIRDSASFWVFKFSVFFNMTRLYAQPVPQGGPERKELKGRMEHIDWAVLAGVKKLKDPKNRTAFVDVSIAVSPPAS